MKLYGIKNCDTVRKAQKFFAAQHCEIEFVDFRQQPLDDKTLQRFIDAVGMEQLVNKRSTTYRGLSDAQKAQIDNALILKNPTLIKRPVLDTGDEIIVGFNEKRYLALI